MWKLWCAFSADRWDMRARISITWRYTAHGLLISVRDVLRQAMCFGSQSPDHHVFRLSITWFSVFLKVTFVCNGVSGNGNACAQVPPWAENAHAVCHRFNTTASTLVQSTSLSLQCSASVILIPHRRNVCPKENWSINDNDFIPLFLFSVNAEQYRFENRPAGCQIIIGPFLAFLI